jgi:phosphoribosylglycinamide formyltransferase
VDMGGGGGCRVSGPTVHFIDEEYDKGTIIAQRPVPVYPTDAPEDVAARVLEQEWILFAEVVGQLCRGDYQWRDDGVIMLRSPSADGPDYV